MNPIDLLKQLQRTKQKFFIKFTEREQTIHCQPFVEDCKSPAGWKVREVGNYSVSVTMHDGSRTRSGGRDYWNVNLSCFEHGGLTIVTDMELLTSNRGQKKCFNCGCKTQMKRDFSDMSIREMCPRCKV